MEAKAQSLRDYLFENLTAKQYEALPATLGITETKLTRLLNNTDRWESVTFTKLVTEIKVFHPVVLLKQFNLKNNITVNEMDDIEKSYEQ
jgi:hypothetical protein